MKSLLTAIAIIAALCVGSFAARHDDAFGDDPPPVRQEADDPVEIRTGDPPPPMPEGDDPFGVRLAGPAHALRQQADDPVETRASNLPPPMPEGNDPFGVRLAGPPHALRQQADDQVETRASDLPLPMLEGDRTRSQQLQEEYVRILRERASQMSDAELKNAIAEAKAETQWLRAESKLQEAADILAEISLDYQGTDRARNATSILAALARSGIRSERMPSDQSLELHQEDSGSHH